MQHETTSLWVPAYDMLVTLINIYHLTDATIRQFFEREIINRASLTQLWGIFVNINQLNITDATKQHFCKHASIEHH